MFIKLSHHTKLQRSEFEGLFVWKFGLRSCGRRRTQLVFLARALAFDTARAIIEWRHNWRHFGGLKTFKHFHRQLHLGTLLNQLPMRQRGRRHKAHGFATGTSAACATNTVRLVGG